MTSCPERKEQLYLALHGELPAAARKDWLGHIKICGGCREELTHLKRIREKVRRDLPDPALSLGEANAMAATIFGKPAATADRHRGFGFLRPVFITGLAAACIIALSAVVFQAYFKVGPDGTDIGNLTADRHTTAVASEDAEIIRNLEILKNFNTIEKLVRVVDNGPDREHAPGITDTMGGHLHDRFDDRRVGNKGYVSYS